MSGGTFDYSNYFMEDIIGKIQHIIQNNNIASRLFNGEKWNKTLLKFMSSRASKILEGV